MALDSDEHGDLVRAIGGGVTPSTYFNVPKQTKTNEVLQELLEEQKKLALAHRQDAEERKSLLEQIKQLQEENLNLKRKNEIKTGCLTSDKDSYTPKDLDEFLTDDSENDENEDDDFQFLGSRDFTKVNTPTYILPSV